MCVYVCVVRVSVDTDNTAYLQTRDEGEEDRERRLRVEGERKGEGREWERGGREKKAGRKQQRVRDSREFVRGCE